MSRARVEQLRDPHGASRAVAYLMLVGAPYLLVTALFVTPVGNLAETALVVAVAVATGVGGAVCFLRPHLLPDGFWFAAPLLATALITGLNVGTADASTGAQLFYLWPVLYAANFLPRRRVYLTLAAVFAGEAVCTFLVLEPGRAVADWVAMALAMTMTSVVVVPLRERADSMRRSLETQALADPLTGLANRRSFEQALRTTGAWAARTGRPLALLTVDLDHFKTINDTYGHAVGDQALRAVATAMLSAAGDHLVARLGGDEFVVLLRTGRHEALSITEALRHAVAAITGLPGGPPGISVGVAVLPDDADSVDGLVTASDAALYAAKTAGRGRVASAGGLHDVEHPAPVTRPASAR